jgi:hypothetical protein
VGGHDLIRLHAVVEGQTEETFFRDTLAPVLAEHEIYADVNRITTGRKRTITFRGGLLAYEHLRRDLTLWMKQDRKPDSWFTTMVDLYRLPADFPGIGKAAAISDPIERVRFLENELQADLEHRQFMPYIQLHEFEALLFSDPSAFSIAFPNDTAAIAKLNEIRGAAPSPEHIDDGEDTSPSKRICRLLPGFVKPASGPIIAKEIGLHRIRSDCRHFNAWIEKLLTLWVTARSCGA